MKRLAVALAIGLVITALPFVFRGVGRWPRAGYYIWWPGLMVAATFYPEGIHTGSGSPAYIFVAIFMNVLIYSLCALGIMSLLVKLKGTK